MHWKWYQELPGMWYEINHMMFMIDLTLCDMYTTNCQVCGTKSSRNSRRCRKHERTSTYTAILDVPVLAWILSCLTVSFCCGTVYSRVKRTPESEKRQMSAYLIKRKIKKKMLVYVPGTCISPFVVAHEGGVNSNPSSRERLFLRTTNPRQDSNSCVHGWHEACCRTQETRPGAWKSSV